MAEVGSFECETYYRLTVEAARVWVISHFLTHGKLPNEAVLFVYPNGPLASLDWGNPAGPDDPQRQPLRRRRIRVTFQVEVEK